MSTFNGAPVVRLDLQIPPSGGWVADVVLAGLPVPALGPVALTVADLSLVGGIARAGLDSPDQPHVIAYGGLGWRALLARRGAYSAPGGVRLSTVLADLARLATYPGGPATGEAYDAPPEALLGDTYEWSASATSAPLRVRAVLSDLAARGHLQTWRVDPSTGRARFDAWPSLGPADGRGIIVSRDLSRGVRRLGLDTQAAALLPGATLEGTTIRRLVLHESAGALRAEAWTS